jgi:hypothetical protein
VFIKVYFCSEALELVALVGVTASDNQPGKGFGVRIETSN